MTLKQFFKKSTLLGFFLLIISVFILGHTLLSLFFTPLITTKSCFMRIAFSSAGLLFSLFFMSSQGYLWVEKNVWKTVTAFSLIIASLILATVFIDYYTSKEYLFSDVVIVHEQHQVDTFMQKTTEKIQAQGGTLPIAIKTGCLLHKIELSSDGKLSIIGYAWQLFDKESEKFSNNELFLPDAIQQSISRAYEFRTDSHLVVGWHIVADFFADYNYVKFPMDKHALLFSFSYKAHDQNVIFVPDYQSYDLSCKNAQQHRGIISEAELMNWVIYKTDFCYYEPKTCNQYGSPASVFLQQELPRFSLIVGVERNYGFALIYSLIPLLVIFFVLFSIALFIGGEELTLFNIVGLISSVFFAILVAHQLYDDSLPPLAKAQITYLDFLYFLSYLYTFLIGIDGMLYYSNSAHIKFVQYKKNRLARMLFWPSLLLCALLGTLAIFAY
jgi:hypothetical protein